MIHANRESSNKTAILAQQDTDPNASGALLDQCRQAQAAAERPGRGRAADEDGAIAHGDSAPCACRQIAFASRSPPRAVCLLIASPTALTPPNSTKESNIPGDV
eukprot:CAMPEP_0170436774 /NCGR_PEP_ID=MMETSP0117_2-20130122/44324_1 /TAXON_ID=400756 /ORGANISM="Durinskia baltica, Strain CSIRO CS-38" /LENGTH=103 /DNA_ID=CAMNT_0010696839 /DNA_START=184 /DNA_END=497 /DNA_ORIENTATION=+